jgi:hypothetical protein
MKKILIVFIVPIMLLLSYCGNPENAKLQHDPEQAEIEAIREVMEYNYVHGIQNLAGAEVIRPGFWEDFEMFMLVDGRIRKLPLNDWIAMVDERKADPNWPDEPVRANYLDIDVTETAASVKLELWRGNNLMFTDYFQLYKFDDRWKIVSKIFHRH